MKLDSIHLDNLLAYARERHGAPCRVELTAGWGCTVVEIYRMDHADFNEWIKAVPVERILI